MSQVTLHGFFRSSTSLRVRIALNLKGIEYKQATYTLREDKHKSEEYLAINPQGLVPSLEWSDGTLLTQSMAIMEFLDENVSGLALLPSDSHGRARVRSICQIIGCDIHPLNNLRVLKTIEHRFGADQKAISDWFRHWVVEAFDPLENMLENSSYTGLYCHGDTPTMADIALVAQAINNLRFGITLEAYPTIERIVNSCLDIPAFERALPQHQPDAL